MKKNIVVFVCCFAVAQSNAGSEYASTKSAIGAGFITAGAVVGAAFAGSFLAHKAGQGLYSRTLAHVPLLQKHLTRHLPPEARLIVKGVGAAAAGILCFNVLGKTIFQSCYTALSRQSLQPSYEDTAVRALETIFLGLLLVDHVEAHVSSLLMQLDSKVYTASTDVSRLQLMDGVHYHLTAHDLIGDLLKLRMLYKHNIQAMSEQLSQLVTQESKVYIKVTTIRQQYADFLNGYHVPFLATQYKELVEQKYPYFYKLYHQLSSNSKLCIDGFNKGINVLQQAIDANNFAHDLRECLQKDMEQQVKRCTAASKELERVRAIEEKIAFIVPNSNNLTKSEEKFCRKL